MNKPREFWIDEKQSFVPSFVNNTFNQKIAHGCFNIDPQKVDMGFVGWTHVIEKSAYDDLEKKYLEMTEVGVQEHTRRIQLQADLNFAVEGLIRITQEYPENFRQIAQYYLGKITDNQAGVVK